MTYETNHSDMIVGVFMRSEHRESPKKSRNIYRNLHMTKATKVGSGGERKPAPSIFEKI